MTQTCILLIDDNDIDRALYKRIIRRGGLDQPIVDFCGGDIALEYMKDKSNPCAELIFLDINMPRMNGFEFLEAATLELGSNFTKAVIVMLTTSLDPRDKARAAGYDVIKRYINKPLFVEEVQEISKLLS